MFTVAVIVLFAIAIGILVFGKPNLDEGVGCAVQPLLWLLFVLFLIGLGASLVRAFG